MANKNRSIVSTVRSKLVAAVAMLLVGVFMVISSSYAWFTLSTAPEVSGIHTSVGANGNLEMALVPSDGLASIPESTVNDANINETWGNLVNLSDNKYGLNDIQLMPARLSVTDGKYAALLVPTYGADGRISGFEDAVHGKYVNNSWIDGDTDGVSAIGTASGMSAQQKDWMQYKRNLNTALAAAQDKADESFETYGSALAGLVMTRAMQGEDATFDISFVGDMIAVLEGANADIATAAKWYFAAKAAEALYNADDATWGAVAEAIATLDFAALAEDATSVEVAGQEVPFDATLTSFMAQYNAIKATLAATKTAWDAFDGVATEATWAETRAILFDTEFLVYENILVNDKTTDEIKDMMGDNFSLEDIPQELMDFGLAFAQNGVVDFVDGTGVHSDFAKLVGEYQAEISVTVSLGSASFTNEKVKLRAKTATRIDAYAALNTQPADNNAEGAVKPITDFYGYMLDLAFRTNAKGSSLMLQTDAVGRIYETNGSDATMGHGSTMTFAAADDSLSMAQVKKLMAAVRIVFMDEEDTILGIGLLEQDTENGTYAISANNEIASSIYLYDWSIDATSGELLVGDMLEATDGKTALMSLDQNTAQQLSVLVYMDGDKVDNSMVAAETAASLTGTLNLQFSSSADLIPMDYNELKGEAASEVASETESETESETVAP